MSNLNFPRPGARFMVLVLVLLFALAFGAFAQTSVSNGSIEGNVTDASGAVVAGAKVTITGPTGQTVHATTNNSGAYTSGPLIPGIYTVRVEAKSFKTSQLTIDVLVNTTANGMIKLEVGQESTVVEVPGQRSTGQHRAGRSAGRADGRPDCQLAGEWAQLP